MIPLEVAELEGLGRLEARTAHITGVQVDSRRVQAGDLFVAVGRGAEFCRAALARGAAATLVPDDAYAALGAVAGKVRERSSARVVGITGSMGKTSTKDILAAICLPSRRTIAAEASYNNEIGVPLTLCRLEPDSELCILELAMRGFGQIRQLCAFARPHVGVITNVGPVHLELVDSIEGVVRAKSELLQALPRGGTAIVPEDLPVERDDIAVVRLGEPHAIPVDGRTRVAFDGREIEFTFSGRHQAQNALAALETARALDVPIPDRVVVEFSRWRGDELPLLGGGLLINDAYNANPVSMRAALAHLVESARGRRTVAILGDMAELGRDAPRYHQEVGAAAAELGIDAVIAIGELARGYGGALWFGTVDEALREVDGIVRPGDCVLVKASRAMGLEAVAEALAGALI